MASSTTSSTSAAAANVKRARRKFLALVAKHGLFSRVVTRGLRHQPALKCSDRHALWSKHARNHTRLASKHEIKQHDENTKLWLPCAWCAVPETTNPVAINVLEHIPSGDMMCVCSPCHGANDFPNAYRRRKISPMDPLRVRVWVAWLGLCMKAPCPGCGVETLCLLSSSWHACHITAESNGGASTVDNLLPGCATCNLACGTQSFEEFMAPRELPRALCLDSALLDIVLSKFK